jgi:hypothetical protein
MLENIADHRVETGVGQRASARSQLYTVGRMQRAYPDAVGDTTPTGSSHAARQRQQDRTGRVQNARAVDKRSRSAMRAML